MSLITDDPACSIFIQAKNFTPANRTSKDIKYVVVHTAEYGCTEGAAMSLAKWAASPSAPQASWTYAVAPGQGPGRIVQSVREHDVCWAAPGANRNGISIEIAGFARWTPDDWDAANAREVIETAARLCGRICKRHGIPVQRLSVADLKGGAARGIIGHIDATQAFGKSTHTDPGKGFPWPRFIDLALEEIA